MNLTTALEDSSWTVTEQFTRQGGTAKFILLDDRSTTGSVQPVFVPQALQTIVFTDTGTGAVLFSGLVTSPTFKRQGPLQTRWQLDCRDWTYISDTTLVAGDFVGFTADQIVVALVAQAACGLTATSTTGGGQVQPAPTINRFQTEYETLSTALTTLAQLASTSSDYGWFIDYNRSVHFFSEAQTPTPTVTLTDNLTALPSTTLGGYDESGFAYVWDGSNVRSACIVRGANYPGNRTDMWLGDGNTEQWQLSFALNTSGALPVLTIGGAVTPVWIAGVSSGTMPASGFQLVQSLTGPWTMQTYGGQGPPGQGAAMSLVYPYLAPVIARVDDGVFEAAYAALPNRGVFEMYVGDTTLLTLATAQARGSAEVTQYSYVQERITLKVAAGFPGHISGGDVVTVTCTFVPDSANGFTAGFTKNFLVLTAVLAGVKTGYRTTAVTAVRID